MTSTPPFDPDPELIDHLEGNRRSLRGYRRKAQRLREETLAATQFDLRFAITVKDSERLPDGLYPSDVAERAADVALAALTAWYEGEARDWLACGPT